VSTVMAVEDMGNSSEVEGKGKEGFRARDDDQ